MLEFIDIRPKFKTLKKVQRTPYLSEIRPWVTRPKINNSVLTIKMIFV